MYKGKESRVAKTTFKKNKVRRRPESILENYKIYLENYKILF